MLVAPACPACHELLERPTRGPVCAACWQAVRPLTPPLCPVCGDPLPAGRLAESAGTTAQVDPSCPRCRSGSSPIARSRAVGDYAGALRAIIHVLKYDRRRSVAPRLARLMARAGADVLAGADAAVPVPLHWRRQWQRGFNQAALLGAQLGIPVWTPLRRVRATSPQVMLAAAARRTNVRNAFAIARTGTPWRSSWRARLEGKTVVLVDDVTTTGATLEACALALRRAGAGEVRALTAARVVGRPR